MLNSCSSAFFQYFCSVFLIHSIILKLLCSSVDGVFPSPSLTSPFPCRILPCLFWKCCFVYKTYLSSNMSSFCAFSWRIDLGSFIQLVWHFLFFYLLFIFRNFLPFTFIPFDNSSNIESFFPVEFQSLSISLYHNGDLYLFLVLAFVPLHFCIDIMILLPQSRLRHSSQYFLLFL